jgi:hypothetical protein
MDEVSGFSNKSYSQNFMLDSKIILHDIFYDISVNFLCIYPTFYTFYSCVMLCTYEYTTLLYTANVFCPHCTV